jgi:hypothetical protein
VPPPNDDDRADAEPDTDDPDAPPEPPPEWAAEFCDLFPDDDDGAAD